MNIPVRAYQGASAEERIEERKQRLLDTAFAVMAADEWKTLSITQLCQLAGLNKRYFYESFDSLDALAEAVIENLTQQVISLAIGTATAGTQDKLDNLALAHSVMQAVLTFLLDDPNRARVLFGERSDGSIARSQRRKVIRTLSEAVSAYGQVFYAADQRAAPFAALVSSMLIGGTVEAILDWLDGDIRLSRKQFIHSMAALWNLTGDAAADLASGKNIS